MKRLIQLAMVLAIASFGVAPGYAHAGTQYQDQGYGQQDGDQQYSDDYPQDQQYDNPQYDPDYDQNYDDQQDYNNDQNYSDDQDYSNDQDYNDDNYNYPSGDQNFNSALSNYGHWVNVSPFGQCWRPNVAGSWRPFSQGHWVTTSYGPTWEGNEPWAWATYHYGHWIWAQQFGWVWIPGSEYTPGNVAWSYGPDSIGWMPEPPYGYDYSRGYLSYVGPQNQFSIYDSGFGFNFGFGENYYPTAYRSLFFNPAYVNVCPNLWFFIGRNQFLGHNYANYYLGPNYARNLFVQRAVRVSSQPMRRDVLQRIVQKPIPVVPVRERTLTLNGHRTKFVAPAKQDERFRRIEPRNTERFIRPVPQKDERFQRNEVPVSKMDRTFRESKRVVPQQQRSYEFYVPKQLRPDNRMEQRNDSFQRNFQRNEQLKDRRIEQDSRPDFNVHKPSPEFRPQQFPSQNRQQSHIANRRIPEFKTTRPEIRNEYPQRMERQLNKEQHTKQKKPKEDYRH
jgi:hypothetical protein